ncbi:ATP-binding protein [Pseudonocardia sp. CA-107938]|uniref:ATP-binding protein n=1 Tax=Pseudonocardia sp. CA-107938 TaxID=3240021 RepID=UPI003D89B52E
MKWSDRLLSTRTVEVAGVPVVELDGLLARRSTAELHTLLRKILLDRGRVLVDADRLRISSTASLAVFPTVLARVGGWPEARLVVVAAGGPVMEGMRATGRHREVAVAPDLAWGLRLLERRPLRVRRTTSLPRAPEGTTALARVLCQVACTDWEIPSHYAERLEFVVNELVTNAVQHTQSELELSLSLDGDGLRASVRDGRRDGVPAPGSGRYGMRIIAELSDVWGVTTHADGKTVWALLRASFPEEV